MAKDDFKFEWNKSSARIIADKGFGKDFNKEVANIVLSHSDKYTPFSKEDYGGKYHMAQMVYTRGTKTEGLIVYTKKYAKDEYNNPHPHYLGAHPLATDHWVEAAWSAEKREITEEINIIRLKFAKR